jgi:hypothetical protein
MFFVVQMTLWHMHEVKAVHEIMHMPQRNLDNEEHRRMIMHTAHELKGTGKKRYARSD